MAAGPYEDVTAAYKRGDYDTSLRRFRPLADQDNAVAQSYLGRMYEGGRGVPHDYVRAHMWFNLSAAQGKSSIAKRMTPAQIAEAQKLAREWQSKRQLEPSTGSTWGLTSSLIYSGLEKAPIW